ncbi:MULTISPECIES: O-antigen ligase family protein [unclassified Roseitalea]|uniref:O-antigen ligase family protein n=1 Tax=unclassified Roseitalea TaxID=2639107 RepID=UPI00273FFB2F|nr:MULTISPECIES: O-antigen ligase family protein [unclassified Roseitalea]
MSVARPLRAGGASRCGPMTRSAFAVPASAYVTAVCVIALFGYGTIAPLAARLIDEGAGLSTLYRAGVLVLVLSSVALIATRLRRPLVWALMPMSAFMLLFGLRAAENAFVRDLPVYVGPDVLFGFLFGSALLPAIAMAVNADRLDDGAFARAMSALLVVFLIGLAFNLEALARSSETRLALGKVNPIALSALALDYLLFLMVFADRSRLVRVLSLLAVPILVLVIAYAKSRGPLIATVLALIVLFASGRRPLIGGAVAILAGLGVFAALAMALLRLDLFAGTLARMRLDGGSAQIRLEQWRAAWTQFLDHPLFGDRIYETAFGFYPHNLFLESLIALGLAGTAILMIALIIAGRAAWTVLRDPAAPRFAVFTALVLVKALGQSMVSGGIWGHTVLWIAMAMTIACALAARRPFGGWSR